VRALQALKAGCPEEVAYEQDWITDAQLGALAEKYRRTDYGAYLKRLLNEG